MPSGDASVTLWLKKLEEGHDNAATRLWDLFFERLVQLVQRRLAGSHDRLADAEDIALSAFASFCRGVENKRFPELKDRHGLWALLVSITIHKLLHVQRDQNRLKRGRGFRQVGQDVETEDGPAAIDLILSREPTPEIAAQVAEQYDRWMKALESEELVRLTNWKLEGYTNDEIAAKCGLATRTIERKLNLIRKILLHEVSEDE